ncbi:MAG: DUF2723 domain-containing protein [Porphyromonadaceae bacterium]|nr:DUF2723 domain-containing protein [Porphyromonadaceae bacterium]
MKQYTLLNNILGWVIFVIAAITYILTLEPTASFWDCGEFISSAYKLEVGHPPGNPIFMLTGRFFANFASDPSHVAHLINLMSGLFSAATILLLFWTITHLARKIILRNNEEMTLARMITILACGAVGALAYAWSDTFWFSAVEGEVYAYSSFCTALVFWLILKWEDVADEPHSDRYIILIAYLIGISIAVHLLNLLTIPALVLVYYFRKFNNPTTKGSIIALLISFAVIVFLLYGLVPGFVKVAGWAELLCVNVLGMPFNSGVIVYFFLVIGCISWGIYETFKQNSLNRLRTSFLISVVLVGLPFISSKIFIGVLISIALALYLFLKKRLPIRLLNMVLVSILVIFIGYSSYALIVIRSSANTPMDQNSPEDVFALGSYLNREQYGDRPLFYGQTFAADIVRKNGSPLYDEGAPIWARKIKESENEPDRYEIIDYKRDYIYNPELCTIFPRMYSSDSRHISAYKEWSDFKGKTVRVNGRMVKKPTFAENMRFFIDYQVNFMYWRYFMWNFSGRQNDIQGNGDAAYGNWITGFPFIDNLLVGNQKLIPTDLKENKGRNVFFMMPLILGLLGLFFQLYSGKKGAQSFWVVFFLFFMTGLAIVVYLNQTPYQPRERDYAYAGSFYAFAIWIGLGVAALSKLLSKKLNPTLATSIAAVISIIVPIQMVSQTWDDHDRSGRYTCRDFGKNYLTSVDENGVIFTNGDNDTFPLWYVQETEGYRTDVRVCNLSYLQTDWYVTQMKSPAYESESLPISMKVSQYGNKKREYGYILDLVDNPISVKNAINYFLSDADRTKNISGFGKLNHFPSSNMFIDIDKDKILASGIIPKGYEDKVVDRMNLSFADKNILMLNEITILDMLSTNAEEGWKRPIYFATTVDPSLFTQTDKYFMRTGMAYKIVPLDLDNTSGRYAVDTDKMYDNVMNKFVWGGVDTNPHIYLDETIRRMCYSYRIMFVDLIDQLIQEGKRDKALKALDYCMEKIPDAIVPHNYISLQLAIYYYVLDQYEKGENLLRKIGDRSIEFVTWSNSLTENKKRSVSRESQYNERAVVEQVIPIFYRYGDEKSGQEYLEKAAFAGIDVNKYFHFIE